MKVSRKVWVIKKELPQTRARLGENATRDMLDNHRRIGSALKGKGPLRGLAFYEEEKLLPNIIGKNPKSSDWEKETEDYWKNISIEVPVGDIDGRNGGLELEVGFEYRNAEGRTKGEKEAEDEYAKFYDALERGETYEMIFEQRHANGRPINIEDFIAWRYMLVNRRIANREEDKNNSRNIWFYMRTKEASSKVQHAKLQTRKKAYGEFVKLSSNRKRVPDVLLLLQREVRMLGEKHKKDYDTNLELDQDILLEALATDYPSRLIEVVGDKNMIEKAFIERCIVQNVLRRIPNTETILYANTTLGYNMTEAVVFLRKPEHKGILQELEAKLTAFKLPVRTKFSGDEEVDKKETTKKGK